MNKILLCFLCLQLTIMADSSSVAIFNDTNIVKSIDISYLPNADADFIIDNAQKPSNTKVEAINLKYTKTIRNEIDYGLEGLYAQDKIDSQNKYYYFGIFGDIIFERYYGFSPYIGLGLGVRYFDLNSINGDKIISTKQTAITGITTPLDMGIKFSTPKLNINFGYRAVGGAGDWLQTESSKKVITSSGEHQVNFEGIKGLYFGLEYKF